VHPLPLLLLLLLLLVLLVLVLVLLVLLVLLVRLWLQLLAPALTRRLLGRAVVAAQEGKERIDARLKGLGFRSRPAGRDWWRPVLSRCVCPQRPQ
jgi:hypothetical protein